MIWVSVMAYLSSGWLITVLKILLNNRKGLVYSLVHRPSQKIMHAMQSLQSSPLNLVLEIQSLKIIQSLQFSPQFSPCNSDDPYHSVFAIKSALQFRRPLPYSPCNSLRISVLAIPTTLTIFSLQFRPHFSPCNSDDPYRLVLVIIIIITDSI